MDTQPAYVYVTVNVVATAVAVTIEYASVALVPAPGVKPVVGLQLYVPPASDPVATRFVLWPEHRLVSIDVTLTVEPMVSINESVDVHPVTLSVTVNLYVCTVGKVPVYVGLATVALLRLVDGDHA